MSKTAASPRRRLEAIGRELAGLRQRLARADAQADAAGGEFADLENRHADLHRRAADLESAPQAEQSLVDALEADLEGLAGSLRRWIARQDADAKAARR